MFQRPRNSSPAPESSSAADAVEVYGRRLQMLLEWRDDANQVGRAYTAWCAANRRDRQRLSSFLDALSREERTAHQRERVVSALGSTDPVT